MAAASFGWGGGGLFSGKPVPRGLPRPPWGPPIATTHLARLVVPHADAGVAVHKCQPRLHGVEVHSIHLLPAAFHSLHRQQLGGPIESLRHSCRSCRHLQESSLLEWGYCKVITGGEFLESRPKGLGLPQRLAAACGPHWSVIH